MSLKDYADEPDDGDDVPAVFVGRLNDGEGMTVSPVAGAETFHSDEYGAGWRMRVVFLESDHEYKWADDPEEDDPEPIENGDEVSLVSWSKRLARALIEESESDDASDLIGEKVTFEKTGDGTSADYSVGVMESDG